MIFLNIHILTAKTTFIQDNPKAYQISQDESPVGHDGWVEIDVAVKEKKIRVERVHLEEDAWEKHPWH